MTDEPTKAKGRTAKPKRSLDEIQAPEWHVCPDCLHRSTGEIIHGATTTAGKPHPKV